MTLDEAYANADFIEGAADYPPRWAKKAAAFREALGARAQLGVSYGPTDRQAFDFFEPEGVSRGTVMFVHGGYWRAFDRADWSHLAAGPLARGWAVAMPSYDLCPDVSIAQIGGQVARALAKVADRTQGALALAGHSAGGQLVARVMDPLLLGAEVRDRVERIACISPLGDLAPLMDLKLNETWGLDAAQVVTESPVNMTPPHGVDVTVWVGADERPGFLEQAEALSRAWGARQVTIEGAHHFDIIDPLEDPESEMVRTLLGVR